MSYHNTWSLRTSYGGINPYALLGRVGLIYTRGISQPEGNAWPTRSAQCPAQGRKADLKIKQDLGQLDRNHYPTTYGNCNQLGLDSRFVTLPLGLYKGRQGPPQIISHHIE